MRGFVFIIMCMCACARVWIIVLSVHHLCMRVCMCVCVRVWFLVVVVMCVRACEYVCACGWVYVCMLSGNSEWHECCCLSLCMCVVWYWWVTVCPSWSFVKGLPGNLPMNYRNCRWVSAEFPQIDYFALKMYRFTKVTKINLGLKKKHYLLVFHLV